MVVLRRTFEPSTSRKVEMLPSDMLNINTKTLGLDVMLNVPVNRGTNVRAKQLHAYHIHLLQRIWRLIQQITPKRWEQGTRTHSIAFHRSYPRSISKTARVRQSDPGAKLVRVNFWQYFKTEDALICSFVLLVLVFCLQGRRVFSIYL